MQETSIHMIMDGCNFTRHVQGFILDGERDKAVQMMDAIRPPLWEKQVEAIFRGDAQIVGVSQCDDPKCWQCNPAPKEGRLRYVEDPDKQFQKSLREMQEYWKKEQETVELAGQQVSRKLLDKYVQFVKSSRRQLSLATFHGNDAPLTAFNSLKMREELHREIFDTVGLPYHADLLNKDDVPAETVIATYALQQAIDKYGEDAGADQ